MKSKGMQFGAMLAAMLIVMATIVVPVVAADESSTPASTSNEKKNSSCTGCANKNASCRGSIAGNVTELQGAEKDKVLDIALKNKEVQKLYDQLKNDGFLQDSTKAFRVPMKTKEGAVVDVEIVTLGFKSSSGEAKQINYVLNTKTGESVVVLGLWSCAECLAMLVLGTIGCGAVCIVGGALSFGTLCILCLAAAEVTLVCPCFDCCCSTTGDSTCCNFVRNHCI